MSSKISRRDFLKVTGAVSVTSAGLLSGCKPNVVGSTDTSGESAIVAEKLEIVDTKECDILVAGTGSAGTAAALRASQLGASVIAIEKNDFLGGTSTLTEGIYGVETALQKEMGITLTRDDVFTDAMSYHHGGANARVLRKWIDETANAIEWLLAQGVKFIEGLPGFVYEGRGAAMLNTLTDQAKANGVTFLTKTSAHELLLEDGKVTGLIAKVGDGQGLQINAPVVILCTGGFSTSAEMIKKYCSEDINQLHNYGLDGRDGDGINIGLAANADIHHPSALMLCGFIVPGVPNFTSSVAQAACFQEGLWVNQDGVRYGNENVVEDWTSMANSAALQKTTYAILDTAHMDALVVENNTFVGAIYGIPALTDLYDQVQELMDAGSDSVFKADTIKELAEKMGVDPTTLVETVDTYNRYCEAGKDDEFCKPAQFLISETKPPFYAFKRMRAFFTNVGGLKVNEKIQVVDNDSVVIPGLYACGSDAGGIYGADYHVRIASGSQQAWAIGGGKLAAEDAVQSYLKL